MKREKKNIKNPRRISSYFFALPGVTVAIVLSGIFYNGFMSAGPILSGRVLDYILDGQPIKVVLKGVALFLCAVLAIQLCRFIKRYFVRVFANKTGLSMRQIVYNNILNRDLGQSREALAGDIMTRSVSDVDACVEGVRKATTEFFDTGVLMIGYIVTMIAYSPKVTLLSSMFIPLAMIIAAAMKSLVYKYNKDYRNHFSKVAEATLDQSSHQFLYRVMGLDAVMEKRYEKELNDLERTGIKSGTIENSMQSVYQAVGTIGLVFLTVLGGKLVLDGQWSVGTFTAYNTIFIALSVKAGKAGKLFNAIEKAKVSWQRVLPYLDERETKKKIAQVGTREKAQTNAPELLSVKNLSCGVLNDVSFSGQEGQIIGITGPVACGKSTLGKALQGILPFEGTIEIRGINFDKISKTDLPGLLTYMGHDSCLLSDSIYNNVALGTLGDVNSALRDADMARDVAAMERGTETTIGSSGERLSGGQQSRLALARTLCHRSTIMIFDEPFGAVDEETELHLTEALRKNYRDCLILIISHRVKHFENFDRILYIQEGTGYFGTHDRVKQSCPSYAALFSEGRDGTC